MMTVNMNKQNFTDRFKMPQSLNTYRVCKMYPMLNQKCATVFSLPSFF